MVACILIDKLKLSRWPVIGKVRRELAYASLGKEAVSYKNSVHVIDIIIHDLSEAISWAVDLLFMVISRAQILSHRVIQVVRLTSFGL